MVTACRFIIKKQQVRICHCLLEQEARTFLFQDAICSRQAKPPSGLEADNVGRALLFLTLLFPILFPSPPLSFRLGMLFSYTLCCSAIPWQREKKGNGTPAPPSAAMIPDETQLRLTKVHEVLTKWTVSWKFKEGKQQ